MLYDNGLLAMLEVERLIAYYYPNRKVAENPDVFRQSVATPVTPRLEAAPMHSDDLNANHERLFIQTVFSASEPSCVSHPLCLWRCG
jgi:hypothetical protein